MTRRIPVIVVGTIAVLALIVGAVAATLYFPYQQAKKRTETQLSEALRVQAQVLLRLPESPGVPDQLQDRPADIDQANEALALAETLLREFPASIEFSVGQLDGGQPVLLLRTRNGQVDTRRLGIGSDGHAAVFMQKALNGRTGTTIGPDFTGRMMLGAYRWVPELQLGLAAKIPLSEIRLPFVQAVLVNSMAWVFVALLIMLGFRAAIVPIRKRLRIRESEYRAMFDSAQDGILIADRESIIRSANPAALKMLGYRQRDLAGRPVGLVCQLDGDQDTPDGIQTRLARAASGVPETPRETTARHKDGSSFPCSLTVSRFTVEGETLSMLILRDISDQKQTAKALVAAKEAAETATRAKSDFLANMSHEIRSPMSGVSGMLELLRSTPLDQAQQQYVELAQDSASSLLSVINDILDLSKIESGNLRLECVPFDPAELVQQVANGFRPRAARRKIALEVETTPETHRVVQGDPLRLRQVLVNLVDNAIKFTHEGEVRIRMEPAAREKGGTGLKFTVSDTGCGMTAEQHGNLFRPYMQADLSTTRLHGGTGLGLSISRRIVELMGGEIGLETTAGKGSTFWFTVGLDRAGAETAADSGKAERDAALASPSPDNQPQAGADEPSRQRQTASRPIKVLVADDKEVNRILCREMLSALGIHATAVCDGQQALEHMTDDAFDLVLMDCQMPVLDGYSASLRIREQESASGRARTPIIALTAHAMSGARADCLAAGMDDHLAKPFRLTQLKSILQTWLPELRETA